MSNIVQSQTVAISPRVSIPASVSRQDAKQLISSLFGNPATAFANTDKVAAHDAFTMRCCALALAKGVYGDSSRLERIESYAVTLPGYSKGKDGSIKGNLGKLIVAYRDAVAIGAAVFDKIASSTNDIDLSLLANSPVFGALIAPPVKQVAIAKPTAPTTAPTTESAPTESGPTESGPTESGPTESAPTESGPTESGPTGNIVDSFAKLFADQPEQAERYLREMAEFAGFTVRRVAAKRTESAKAAKAA